MNHLLRAIQCVAMGLCLLGGWGCARRSPRDSIATDDKMATANLASAVETTEQLPERQPVVPAHSDSAKVSTVSVPTAERRATLAPDRENSAEASSGDAPTAWVATGSWTTQRFVALAETGPIVIDLSVNVGNLSLREANDRLLTRATAELLTTTPATNHAEGISESSLASSELSISWEQLLELPLVQSGWLGNLVASSEQTGQLIDQYDSDRDAKVSAQELRMFLSRGLERSAALQVADIGEAPDRRPNTSPWGSGDLNQDHGLDANERDQFAESLSRRDLNADGLITPAEWSDSSDDASQMAMIDGENRNSFLRNQTLLLRDTSEEDSRSESASTSGNRTIDDTVQTASDKAIADKSARKLASETLKHYTFLAELSRSQWMGWSDAQWQAIDLNQDQAVDQKELQQLATIPAQAHIYLGWPDSELAKTGDSATASDPIGAVQVHGLVADTTAAAWHGRLEGGTLVCGDCSLSITAVDGFSARSKQLWRQQLAQALQNPQFKTFLVSRLELQPDAFDVLDEDQDQQLSDAEFARVWQWLSVRQSARVMSQWMLSSQPVFQLLDSNADQRLSQAEIEQLTTRFSELDRDGDGAIAPNELPLVVSLRANRSDRRLEAISVIGQASEPAVDSDWFSAMDVNRDANISRSEFLGEPSDFERLDADHDGLLSRAEGFGANR